MVEVDHVSYVTYKGVAELTDVTQLTPGPARAHLQSPLGDLLASHYNSCGCLFIIQKGPMAQSLLDQYWAQFRWSLPASAERPLAYYDAFSFGMTPEEATTIVALVLAGTKTATGSLLWVYEAVGKRPPQPGDFNIVYDGERRPVCIIQTSTVQLLPFDDVDATFADANGEGDRTLAGWRAIYWPYIVAECARIGREPNLKTPLVCERFQVVYAEPLQGSEL
jgi:uncharacterized protein YhfF